MMTKSRVIVLPRIDRTTESKSKQPSSAPPDGTILPSAKRAGDKLFAVAAGLFLVGIAIGSILISMQNFSAMTYLSHQVGMGLSSRLTSSNYATFVNCLLPHLLFLAFLLLTANCTVGLPFVVTGILVKGIGIGFLGGYIHQILGWSGLLYNLVILMPPVFLAGIAFLRMAVESARQSIMLYGMAFRGLGHNLRGAMAELNHLLVISTMLSCGAALLETILFRLLAHLFLAGTLLS